MARDIEVYKKWFKTKSQSGFLTLREWYLGQKIIIDIGETNNQGGLKSNTQVYANVIELATFLESIRNNTGSSLYPKKQSDPSPETFVQYGGGFERGNDNIPVSRILKIHHWELSQKDGSERRFDSSSFVWKTAKLHARKTQSGAFTPDTSKGPISVNFIKVTRQEMAVISKSIDLSLLAFLSGNEERYRHLTERHEEAEEAS